MGSLLNGRRIAVVGGSAGIGLATARLAVDPRLSHVEELRRALPDGQTEFVARFWYLPQS